MKRTVKHKFFFLFFFSLVILCAIFLITSKTAALEVAWPTSPAGTDMTDTTTLGEMIKYFYEWAIALGGIATFYSLVMGGIKYLSSAGNPSEMAEGKDRIKSAFMGLSLLLSSYIILNTLNPAFTTFVPPEFNLSGTGDMSSGIVYEDQPSCTHAKVYPGNDFEGTPKIIYANDKPWNAYNDGKYIASVRAYTVDRYGEDVACDEEFQGNACGCTVKLFQGVGVCIETKTNITATDSNLERHVEGQEDENVQPITCINLVSPREPYPCIIDKVGDTCPLCMTDDGDGHCVCVETGWGEGSPGCTDPDPEKCCQESDQRCTGGICRKCEGELANDGCGGCAQQGGEACWYLSPRGGTCYQACISHGAKCVGLPPADYHTSQWDDNASCDVCIDVVKDELGYDAVCSGVCDIYTDAPRYTHPDSLIPFYPANTCYERCTLDWFGSQTRREDARGCYNSFSDFYRLCVCTF